MTQPTETTAIHMLQNAEAGEFYRFRPQSDGSVLVDHLYPRGLPGYCYRPGVGRMDRRMTRAAARAVYARAVAAGWTRC